MQLKGIKTAINEQLATSLAEMGCPAADLTELHCLRRRPGHAVYRICCRGRFYVLKWFAGQGPHLELQVYALLGELGVPVLPVHGRTNDAILLEDLDHSLQWRQALAADMKAVATGMAVAAWYRKLHEAGYALLARERPSFLSSWTDRITRPNLERTGAKLDLTEYTSWRFALGHAGTLVRRYHNLPHTFNYFDFAAENLALSRSEPLQAIVFDYDRFCYGTAYCDWWNVTSGLRDEARAAFVDEYVDVRQLVNEFDEPLGVLYGLIEAASRTQFPSWAQPLRQAVHSGELEKLVHRALEQTVP